MVAYKRFLIIASRKDIAGSAMHALLERHFETDASSGVSWLRPSARADLRIPDDVSAALLLCDEDIINAPMALVHELNIDFVLFASRHSSYKHEKTLTCHTIGNFSAAEYGGADRTLCLCDSRMMKSTLLFLQKRKVDGYEVTQEATHHGPLCPVPSMFVETGSTEEEWRDPLACRVAADAIIHALRQEWDPAWASAVGIGGLHRSTVLAKVHLGDSSAVALGHICPKYMTAQLDSGLLQQMLEKTLPRPTQILFDWKSTEEKERILAWATATGLEVRKLK